TVGQVMDSFISGVPGAPLDKTVDTLKCGERETTVSGMVTTMFPTLEIIEKTIALGANFIIAHEPAFYNHLDETQWLQNDDVYRYKWDLLTKNNIAIWRNHDYIHRHVPDGVLEGVVNKLNWKPYQDTKESTVFHLPAQDLKTLIQKVKSSLGISALRYIGDLSHSCRKILLLPGAYGGRRHIEAIGATKPDVLLCGEIQEWETAEYIRDARRKGQNISLIVMGHAVSEEPGAGYMAAWLKKNFPGVTTTHIPSQNPLLFL
ncbi:MAG TPA: Nif3-like dinuclear metal center hexameric protein, partial [Flavisolibacter sp.]|nr:Nif3-like dinuclear metal center hexameric protein [Flavisolibacter sp.]